MNTPENNPGIKEPNSIKDRVRGLPFCLKAELTFLTFLSSLSLVVALGFEPNHSTSSPFRLMPYPTRSMGIDYLNIGKLREIPQLVEIICPGRNFSEALRIENTIRQIEDRIEQNKGNYQVLALLEDSLNNQTKIAQTCPPTA